MDGVRRQFTGLDDAFGLHDGHPSRHRAQRVEVAGRRVEDAVSVPVGDRRPYQREVGADGLLQQIAAATELPCLLGRRGQRDAAVRGVPPRQAARLDLGPHAGRGVERGHSGTAGPQPFGESALRCQLHLQFTGQVLTGELLVLPHVGGGHPGDTAGPQQQTESPVVHSAVVGHDPQAGHARGGERRDQRRRDAAQAETADREGRPVGDVRHCPRGSGHHFVHADSFLTGVRSVRRPGPPTTTRPGRVLLSFARTVGPGPCGPKP